MKFFIVVLIISACAGCQVVNTSRQSTMPLESQGLSCLEIKNSSPESQSGYYVVDLDGQKPLPPIRIYCDMVTEGGGWMLFAHHTDGLDSLTTTKNVTTNKFGVISKQHWVAMRDSMTNGMLFVDEKERVSRISSAKLFGANCEPVSNINNLTDLSKNGSRYIWHHENRGCDVRGLDYSLITLIDSSTSKSYREAGAALYQSGSMKFDVWPYGNETSSYKHQNTLFYFIK
ncbi:fibrinogen-like YCDxxxxGGGW domain-containing protein [Thalassolituus sp.]|jgi:hypothetical protein|uniref:fibrinogen-like YCDxxxxGGGW domain-containing protein n=1 Tax=Thalassolituus sp. TaxID=2030822 RepID=UPI0032D9893A